MLIKINKRRNQAQPYRLLAMIIIWPRSPVLTTFASQFGCKEKKHSLPKIENGDEVLAVKRTQSKRPNIVQVAKTTRVNTALIH